MFVLCTSCNVPEESETNIRKGLSFKPNLIIMLLNQAAAVSNSLLVIYEVKIIYEILLLMLIKAAFFAFGISRRLGIRIWSLLDFKLIAKAPEHKSSTKEKFIFFLASYEGNCAYHM